MAAQASAASSLGKVPHHVSTPGSATQRRSPYSDRARSARRRRRSGLIRARRRRHLRRSAGAGSTPRWVSRAATTASATSAGASASSWATTLARYPVEPPLAHGVVQAVESRLFRQRAGVVDPRNPTGRQPDGEVDPSLGLDVRSAQRGCDEVGGVEGDVAWHVVDLDDRPVLGPVGLHCGELGDGGVLHCGHGVDEGLCGTHHVGELLTPTGRCVSI